MAVIVGLLTGALCAIPMVYVLRESIREQPRIGMGHALASGVAPFMLLQFLIVLVWLVRRGAVVGFGVGAAFGMLLMVVAGAVRYRHQ